MQQIVPRDAPAQQQGALGTAIPSSAPKPTAPVKGPDGKTYQFPADASDAEIIAFFQSTKPAATADASKTPQTFGDNLMAFGQGVLEQVNPITLLTSLYQGVTHPIDTVTGLAQAQIDQFKEAKKAYDEGRYSEAFGGTLAGLLPILGPQAAAIGQTIGSGDVAHGLGQATGLVGTIAAPSLVKGAAKGAAALPGAEAAAAALERGSTARMVDVMAPKVGANKTRFGNMAADVAPQLAAEPGLVSRSRLSLQRKIADKLATAEGELDAAADSRNAGAAYPTAPILAELKKARQALTAETVVGSYPTPAMTGTSPSGLVKMPEAVPLGKDVVPTPNLTRVKQIDQAIAEIEQLGPVARYEALRRIRASYDQVAKVKYSPSMTADFLSKNAEASGAADVTRALREHLASIDPKTSAANQSYALFRKANDVLDATEEIERTRPKVGRQIAARFAGAITGAEAGGATGAMVGAIIAPVVDGLLNSGPTTKVMSARALTALSTALRTGNADSIAAALSRARAIMVAANAVSGAPKKDEEK